MSAWTLRVRALDDKAVLPFKAYPADAAWDLTLIEAVQLRPGKVERLRTGLSIEIPEGYFGLLRERSSAAMKGLQVCAGVIDSGYRGELLICMRSDQEVALAAGDRVAQLLLIPVPAVSCQWVERLNPSVRNEGGFGSSG